MTATSEGPAAAGSGQLRAGLWHTVNERYPGSMITKNDVVPLADLRRPLSDARLTFVSTSGVQPRGTLPFDVVHPVGDYSFRRVPSDSRPADLEIHQLKYPTDGAHRDLNVIFPIERLQELAAEGVVGGLTPSFFTFLGYNMDPDLLERTLAEDLAEAVAAEHADLALLAPA
jgi:D-proline reductase (dithiol) PrdB